MNIARRGGALEGIAEAKNGNTLLGLQIFTGAARSTQSPEARAWHGYCLAKEKNAFFQGISLCYEALQTKPGSSDIYLALGRIYLLTGHRASAVKTLQKGLQLDNNREISKLINGIGNRKPPVFRFLNRNSLVNIVSGRLMSKFGLR